MQLITTSKLTSVFYQPAYTDDFHCFLTLAVLQDSTTRHKGRKQTFRIIICFAFTVKEARLKEIKSEILNSEKLKVSLSSVRNCKNDKH